MEQDDLKATELDRMTSSYSLQMMKASLSYLPTAPRRFLSLFIKMQELKNTMDLFSSPDALSICSAGHSQSFYDAISDIKEYGSPEQRRSFERMENLIQFFSLYEQSQSETAPRQPSYGEQSESGGIIPFEKNRKTLSAASLPSQPDFREYVRNTLTPENQALFDTYTAFFHSLGNLSGKEPDDHELL